jgi:hypothetical protein
MRQCVEVADHHPLATGVLALRNREGQLVCASNFGKSFSLERELGRRVLPRDFVLLAVLLVARARYDV